MMRHLFLVFLCLSYLATTGQTHQPGPDAEAKRLLEKVESINLDASNVFYDFSLTFHFPEEEPVVQKGSYVQAGEKYRLELESYSFICDGISQWVIDREAREIQIHDYAEPDLEDVSTPQGLLKIYNNTQFDFILTFDGNKNGKTVQEIEFKPLRKDAEYAKARLTILKNNHQIHSIELFNKNGSRYILDILQFVSNKSINSDEFNLSEKEYPGFHIEDLRIE